MSAEEHTRWEEDLAAYLLGALPGEEARELEEHLAACSRCQEDRRRLEVSIAAVGGSVEQVSPPPALRARLLETVQGEAVHAPEPRAGRTFGRPRWRLPSLRPAAAGLAAASLLVAGVAGYALRGGDGRRTLEARATTAAPGARAKLVSRDGQAQLTVDRLPAPRAGRVYEVWLKDGDRVTPSTLFSVDRRGRGAAAIPGGLRGADQVMVSEEPARGSPAPTTAPRLIADTS
ncbi:MAG: anti-sigma factor domain-containing protein [Thermoleophilaceae bacterium]